MKKFLALLLAVVMVLTMVACGEGKKKADGQVVIGTSTEASGDWAYSAFVRNPNATDKAVMTLTDDMTTVDSDQHGDYGINKTVVKSYERIEEENGNVTYKFVINDGLKFNNGEAVTAQNFVAWTMFVTSPAGKEMGVVSATYNMLPGGLAYRNGETNVLSAVRLYDEKTFSITIAKTGMSGDPGTLVRILEILAKHEVNVEYIPSGIDIISLVVESKKVSKCLYAMLGELQKEVQPNKITVTEHIAVVAAVGRKMAYRPGVSGKIFAKLGENGVNIRMITQGPEELNIIVGVEEKDFAQAIRVLYDSFVKEHI